MFIVPASLNYKEFKEHLAWERNPIKGTQTSLLLISMLISDFVLVFVWQR